MSCPVSWSTYYFRRHVRSPARFPFIDVMSGILLDFVCRRHAQCPARLPSSGVMSCVLLMYIPGLWFYSWCIFCGLHSSLGQCRWVISRKIVINCYYYYYYIASGLPVELGIISFKMDSSFKTNGCKHSRIKHTCQRQHKSPYTFCFPMDTSCVD